MSPSCLALALSFFAAPDCAPLGAAGPDLGGRAEAAVVPGGFAAPARSLSGWAEMLSALNAVRKAGATCGGTPMPPAAPLVWDRRLAAAADRHVRDMATHKRFSHRGSDGLHAGERARRMGYDWRALGENIARHQRSVDQVLDDWLASPSHCRQIMSPAYAEVGAAKVGGYWAQVFGTFR